MKVLVTGAAGLLGSEVVKQLAAGKQFDIVAWLRQAPENHATGNVRFVTGDLTDLSFVESMMRSVSPDCVVHCAANVNLADCEQNKSYTKALHVDATRILAGTIPLQKFVYISTDSVFNGSEGMYTEASVTDPLNYYAETKLAGEKAALENCENTIVVRTNIYGVNPVLKNSLAEWGLKNLSAGKQINGFTDVVFNPLSTGQLAGAIKSLLLSTFTGVINLASNAIVSKDAFLRMLAKTAGFSESLIKAASMSSMATDIKRPLATSLNTQLYHSQFHQMFSLQEGLNEVVSSYKATVNE